MRPSAVSERASRVPIAPYPTTPAVRPASSRPSQPAFSQSPAPTRAAFGANGRIPANAPHTMYSVVATAEYAGKFAITSPSSRARRTSSQSYPVAATTVSRTLPKFSRNGLASMLLTKTKSAPASARRTPSGRADAGQRSTSTPRSCNRSR